MKIFPVAPRGFEPDSYLSQTLQLARFCEENGFAGILLFTSNDTPVEPWILAQKIIQETNSIVPLVAVNPMYINPFVVARFCLSIAKVYKRKIAFNFITGTSISDQTAIGESLSHNERYDRLGEYIEILKALLSSRKPFDFDGLYYRFRKIRLTPSFPTELMPDFLVAGQSEKAGELVNKLGLTRMTMFAESARVLTGSTRGINVGIITRRTTEDAWSTAEALFPEDEEGRLLHQFALKNTDSVWKTELDKLAVGIDLSQPSRGAIWLIPFKSFRSDCPYFVGSYKEVAELFTDIHRQGVTHMILDVSNDIEELRHVAEAIKDLPSLTCKSR